jgi:hypothetical protein
VGSQVQYPKAIHHLLLLGDVSGIYYLIQYLICT